MIGAFVRMPLAAAVVFYHQVHFLDAVAPDDAVVLPELRHVDVFLVNARLFIDVGADAAVASVLPFVRDVTDAPGCGFSSRRFL